MDKKYIFFYIFYFKVQDFSSKLSICFILDIYLFNVIYFYLIYIYYFYFKTVIQYEFVHKKKLKGK